MLLLSLFFSCFILRSDRLCRNPRHCSLRVSWTSRNYHRVVLYGDVAKACSLQKFGFSKLLNSCCAMSTSLAAHVLDMLAYVCHSMTFYDDGNDRSLVHAASSPCGHVAELKQLVGKSDWQGPSSHRGNHLFLHNNSSHNT